MFLQIVLIIKLLQIDVYIFLCCTVYPCDLSILYIEVCISQSHTYVASPLQPLLTGNCQFVLYICRCVLFHYTHSFELLDCTYKQYLLILVSLYLIYFTKHKTFQVHPQCENGRILFLLMAAVFHFVCIYTCIYNVVYIICT